MSNETYVFMSNETPIFMSNEITIFMSNAITIFMIFISNENNVVCYEANEK